MSHIGVWLALLLCAHHNSGSLPLMESGRKGNEKRNKAKTAKHIRPLRWKRVKIKEGHLKEENTLKISS